MQLSKRYRNEFRKDKNHSGLISIFTVPQVAIGQRAMLCCTRFGNVLWDCITYIDEDTICRINEFGGIKAIVISHPHYFSTSVHWAEAFGCLVFVSYEDESWLPRRIPGSEIMAGDNSNLTNVKYYMGPKHILWSGPELNLMDGAIHVVKVGGHFPGSSVLLWRETRKLLVADSIFVVPSGVYHINRPPGTVSFSFMWSYPNLVSRTFLLPCSYRFNKCQIPCSE